jgi:hypothetical protein
MEMIYNNVGGVHIRNAKSFIKKFRLVRLLRRSSQRNKSRFLFTSSIRQVEMERLEASPPGALLVVTLSHTTRLQTPDGLTKSFSNGIVHGHGYYDQTASSIKQLSIEVSELHVGEDGELRLTCVATIPGYVNQNEVFADERKTSVISEWSKFFFLARKLNIVSLFQSLLK